MTKRKIKIIVEGGPGAGKSKTATAIADIIALANADVKLMDDDDGGRSSLEVRPPRALSDLAFHARIRDAIANIGDLNRTVEFEVVTHNLPKK